MVMQFQFDVLSQVNVSHGTEFRKYDLFDDAPENFNFGGWLANIAIGVAIAAVCVLGAVFTGGLLGAALLGAAIGAAAVTATIAIEDMNDGEVRSAKAAVGQIACGAIAGAAIGYTGAYVMPFGVGTIGTHATFGVLSGATMRVATSGAMEHIDIIDRLGYIFNPLYIASDALSAVFMGGLLNRSALGTAFPTQEMVSSYNVARQTAMTSLQQAKNATSAQKTTGSTDSPDFTGTLKGEDVTLPGVKTQTVEYTKRSSEELQQLRKQFDANVRSDFLKSLGEDTDALLRAGFSENEILSIQSGYVPKGWQVHHKLPLDDGGTNAFSNLILIKNDPFHKVITNFQNSFAQTLSPGETTIVDYPIPEGNIYPPIH